MYQTGRRNERFMYQTGRKNERSVSDPVYFNSESERKDLLSKWGGLGRRSFLIFSSLPRDSRLI